MRTLADLEAAPRDLPETFELDVGGRTFHIQAVLRWLPGKRMTAKVAEGHVLKLFIGERAGPRLKRELDGVQAFVAAGLATPEVLEQGQHWLLFRGLVSAVHAGAEHMERLAATLAQLHNAGYAHGDLHLGNFLVADEQLFVVDGDSVVERPVPLAFGLNELAVLLAQFSVMVEGLEQRAEQAYLGARNESGVSGIKARVDVARQKRVAHYLAKSRRTCTEFEVAHLPVGRLVSRRDAWPVAEQFADVAAQSFSGSLLKDGGSATVARIELAGRTYVAKRYNLKGVFHRIRRIFRRRARHAWEAALVLEFLGLPTARALCLLETGPRIWPGPAYLLCEDLGDHDLAQATTDGEIDPDLASQLKGLLDGLARAAVTHNDFKSTNLLIHNGQLHLIDTDGVALGSESQDRDLERLLGNWPDGSPVREAVRNAIVRTPE